jgi:hypothetical protein
MKNKLDSYFQTFLIAFSAFVLIFSYSFIGEWAKTPLLLLGAYQMFNAFYYTRQKAFKYPINVFVNQYFILSFLYALIFVSTSILGFNVFAKYVFYFGAFSLSIVYNTITYKRLGKEIKSFV